ncbi:MAG: PaaI family thioesterase [Deltaproteobacteria bacterium]
MNEKLHDALKQRSRTEPYARLLKMEAVQVGKGKAAVRMRVSPDLENVFGSTHGGALFSLIDEAFQLACNSHGVLSVALNVSITFVTAPSGDALLEARATEAHKSNRTSSYLCEVRDVQDDKLIATAQALAYRTGKQIDS